MARVKEFDPDVVLARALDLFWRNGYEATSMADLVEHLGIGRASIYATYGSKRDLYLKALELYGRATGLSSAEALSRPGPVLPAIRDLLFAFATGSPDRPKGCLVVNAAIELMDSDREVGRQVESSWDRLELSLTSAMLRARAQGEIPADKDPEALARFLLVVMQGLRVLGHGEPDPARVRDAVDQAIATLR